MGRPVDHARREQLLAAAAEHLRVTGDATASLDAIAARAGTTRRMLLHHFGSKEALVAAALARCADEGRHLVAVLSAALDGTDPAEAVMTFWAWLTADDGRSMRLFFSTAAQSLSDSASALSPYPAETTREWVRLIETIGPDLPRGAPTLIVAAIRGLLLDRLLTGDVERTDDAARALCDLLTAR